MDDYTHHMPNKHILVSIFYYQCVHAGGVAKIDVFTLRSFLHAEYLKGWQSQVGQG